MGLDLKAIGPRLYINQPTQQQLKRQESPNHFLHKEIKIQEIPEVCIYNRNLIHLKISSTDSEV